MDLFERVVVSPGSGVFSPRLDVPHDLEVGTTLGYLSSTGGAEVPVVSPFRGRLMSMVAVAGERLEQYQRVAWLRAS